MTPPTQPDAFIYLPGLSSPIDQSGSGITKRLAQALDRSAQTDEAKFFVDPQVSEETFGIDNDLKTKAYSIKRKDGDVDTEIVDLYEMDYRPILTKKYAEQNIVVKALRVLWILLLNLRRFFQAIIPGRRAKKSLAKSNQEKIQIFYALGILGLALVYFYFLGIAAYQVLWPPAPPAAKTAIAAGTKAQSAPASKVPAPKPAAEVAKTANPHSSSAAADASPPQRQGPGWAVFVVVAAAVLELFWPGLKQGWSGIAEQYLAAMEYLGQGTRKVVVGGQLTDLLEHLAEKRKYRHIHLLSYSFGTLVALDNIFPAERQPGALALANCIL